MPPALIIVILVAIGVPAALRSAIGRPRHLVAAWIASLTAVLVAQVLGEVSGGRAGVLGDAQLVAALASSFIASVAVIALERQPLR